MLQSIQELIHYQAQNHANHANRHANHANHANHACCLGKAATGSTTPAVLASPFVVGGRSFVLHDNGSGTSGEGF